MRAEILPLRWLWIAIGLTLTIWIGIEDRSLKLVTIEAALVSAGLGASGAVRILSRLQPVAWRRTAWLGGIGGLAGAAWGPIALVLIAIKTSLHTHPVPDFTQADIAGVLNRIPVWMVIGALLGLGVGLLGLADRRTTGTDE